MTERPKKPAMPTPPPMMKIRNEVHINEYEDVDWYTGRGELYPYKVNTHKNVFERLFGCEWKDKLEDSIKRNHKLYNSEQGGGGK